MGTMFQKFKDWFAPTADDAPISVTVAMLLAEAAITDGAVDASERAVIEKALAARFDLDQAAASALFDQGLKQASASVDLYSPARDVRKALSPEQRVKVVEMLWEAVYADGRLHDREADMMRRIAKLLYVEDRDSATARRRVLDRKARVDGSGA